jgi:peptidoglycan L-alanyl-D-glutamate endopeptidase CwlK
MPFGNVSNARLDEVHPILTLRVRQVERMLNVEGLDIAVVQGMRSWAQQDVLYAQGRTAPGKIVTNAKGRTAPGKIVTNAKGGESAHQFGYAVDLCIDTPGVGGWKFDWNASDPAWQRLFAVATSCGLAEGCAWRSFPDNPHFFLQELPANPTDEMRQVLLNEGIQALWGTWASLFQSGS